MAKKVTPKLAEYVQNIKKAPKSQLKTPKGFVIPRPVRPPGIKKSKKYA